MAHKTESGKTSRAWANLEERFAVMMRKAGFKKAKVLPRDRQRSKPDVDVPEVPFIAIDTKYKNAGFHHHTLFKNQVETYRGMLRYNDKNDNRYSICAMPTRSGGEQQIYVTTTAEDFIKLMQLAFMRDLEPGWNCPQCPGKLALESENMGLYKHKCDRCGLELMSNQKFEADTVDKDEERSRRKRPKKTEIIKDLSQTPLADEFKPLPGQRSLKDVLKKKQEK